jgi:hypothetical protein
MASNLKKDGKLFISSAAASGDIADQAAGEAITWVEIGQIVTFPSFGVTENTVSQDYVNTDVSEAQKGFKRGVTSEILVGVDFDDAGQTALRAASETRLNWYLKLEGSDAKAGTTNTVRYARFLINQPDFAGGGGEDFDNEAYPVTLQQVAVVVAPEVI